MRKRYGRNRRIKRGGGYHPHTRSRRGKTRRIKRYGSARGGIRL